jgi:hypothetical protein
MISTHGLNWTQAAGFNDTVNGVRANFTPASGTVFNVLGYNAVGTPVYQSASSLSGVNLYNTDGSLTAARTVTMSSYNLTFSSSSGNLIFNPSSSGKVGIGITSPTSNLHAKGSFATKVTTVSANTTLDATHSTVLVSTGSSDKTITLPAASTCTDRIYCIKKTDSGSGDLIIDGNGSENIDGSNTYTMHDQNNAVIIQSDGSNWFVLAKK